MGILLEKTDQGTWRVKIGSLPYAVRTATQIRSAVRKVTDDPGRDLSGGCERAMNANADKFVRVLLGKRTGTVGTPAGGHEYRVFYTVETGDTSPVSELSDAVVFADPEDAVSVSKDMLSKKKADAAVVRDADGIVIWDSTTEHPEADWIWPVFGPMVYMQGLSPEEAMAYILVDMEGMTPTDAAAFASTLRGHPLKRTELQTFLQRGRRKIAGLEQSSSDPPI